MLQSDSCSGWCDVMVAIAGMSVEVDVLMHIAV